MGFLKGLNDSYASIRSQILLMDPLPSMAKAYSLFLQEERQRSLSDSRFFPLDQSAMTVWQSNPSLGDKSKPQYHCSICNIDGHSSSRCYSKIGYPSWWKHILPIRNLIMVLQPIMVVTQDLTPCKLIPLLLLFPHLRTLHLRII